MSRTVTLTDTSGHRTGTMDSIEAHTGKGSLHKAFSVYVFRNQGQQVLIQQRAAKKMLWPGIWANTCCSHPFEGEAPVTAGQRRLQEELGFTLPLKEHSTFVYRAEDPFGKGVEHEHVTILIGDADDAVAVKPDPDEVSDWKWMAVADLIHELEQHPDAYAPWLHLGLQKILIAL